MKKSLIILLLAILCITGCAKKKTFEEKLEGTYSFTVWSDVLGPVKYQYIFQKDGTVKGIISADNYNKEKSASGTWKYENGVITVFIGGEDPKFNVTETDDSVSLTYEGVSLEKE